MDAFNNTHWQYYILPDKGYRSALERIWLHENSSCITELVNLAACEEM